MNWDISCYVMKEMGFGDRRVGWIKWCVTTASFLISINGSAIGYFKNLGGLRQGDLLSPYLFVLIMEAFNYLMQRAEQGRFISRWKVVNGRNISHLLFVDDTLIFCYASKEQLTHLLWILLWFEMLSGPKINLHKIKVIPIGKEVRGERLAKLLGCKLGKLPTTYLGLPLGASYKSKAMWDGVEERFRKDNICQKWGD